MGTKISGILALRRMMEQHQMQAHKERERRTSGSGEVLKQTRARSLSHTHTHTRTTLLRPRSSKRNVLAGLELVKGVDGGGVGLFTLLY